MKRLVTVIAAVLLSRTVAAQPQPQLETPGGDEKADAKSLMQLGVKLLKSKDYLGALAVFKDAYARFPSPKILLNIGTTLKLLDRNAEAANTYQQYLDANETDPQRRDEVTRELGELDRNLAQLAITAPDGAELQIDTDDWLAPARAKAFRVGPGTYTVRARRAGYKPFTTTGTIAAAARVIITVTLEPVPVAVAVMPSAEPAVIAVVPEEPRSRIAALAFGHFDFKNGGGAAAFVGASFDVTRRLEVQLAGILGPTSGLYAGASFALTTGTVRPVISAGLPVFFSSGARYAVRGAVGLELAASRHFALILEVGVEHDFRPPSTIDVGGMARSVTTTAIIPAIGATARL